MNKNIDLIHKGCGGVIEASDLVFYSYVQDDGKIEYHPKLTCTKCKVEIEGDAQIEDWEDL